MKLELSKTNRQNIEDIYPLSPMQEGMLFETLLAPNSGVYFEQIICTLTGSVNVKTFEQAWQQVVAKHSIFRTAFVWESLSQPIQVVYRQVQVKVETYDWRSLSTIEQQQQLETFLEKERQQDLPLSQAPLMRLHLLRMDENTYQFVWCHHHILLDGWSLPLVFKDLLDCYQAISQGENLPQQRTISYRNYIAWLQQQNKSLAAQFWRQKLTGFSAPTPLTVDKPLSMRSPHSSYSEQHIQLTVPQTDAVVSFARQHQLTVNNLVQATWGLLLSRYSQQTDVVFGVTVSGRPPSLVGVESMVGVFINTLPMRMQIAQKTELLSLLKDLQAQQLESEQFSYSSLVEIQGLSDVPRGMSLFESIVIFENYPVDDAVLEDRRSFSISNVWGIEHTNYPLTVVAASGEQLLLKMSYDTSRFEDSTISRMLGHFATMLQAIVTNPQQRISSLPLLTESESRQLLVEWNDTSKNYPSDKCIHQLFEEQVKRTPNAVAVVFEDQQLTYQQLNCRANQLAHYLQSRGVGANVLVGICVERSLDMVVGLLGILKAGGAYMPLDSAYPQERLSYMLMNSGVKVLLTQQQLTEILPKHEAVVVCLDTDWHQIAKHSDKNPIAEILFNNLAYIIYTSGSTGKPKGAGVYHRGFVNLVNWMITDYQFTSTDSTVLISSLSFDLTQKNIFAPLIVGGILHLLPDEFDPAYILDVISKQQVTWVNCTPSTFSSILTSSDDSFAKIQSLRYVFLGGEPISIPSLLSWLNSPDCSAKIVNSYGPTECADVCSAYTVEQPNEFLNKPIPIGKPIPNVKLYILDPNLQIVPVGAIGELCIAGVGVGMGYINDEQRTNEKFIPNPFSDDKSERLYKTGDLVRYLSDGNIEYIGRIDNQVKIRGFRIELGEIETVLNTHPQVQQAVVVAREDIPDDRRLVAYLVPRDGSLTTRQLREFLKRELPEYMVPSAIVILESLPLSPNGKVDRRALPAPEPSSEFSERYVAPRTPVEEILSLIWTQVLKVERVGIHDNFFELGGHSLLATQLISRVRSSLKVELPLRSLFAAPTIASLSQNIQQLQQQDSASAPPILPRQTDAALPLSYAQQRLWFLDQFEPNSTFYNIPAALRLQGTLQVAALEQSFIEIIHRHEALRTNFMTVDGQASQVIHEATNWRLSVVDLQHLPPTEQEITSLSLAQQQALQPFNLATEVLVRATLVVLSETEHVLLVCMHHIVSDGWSMGVLISELAALYNAYSKGQSCPLVPLPIQYADFALWQRQWLQGEVLQSQLSYWRQQLASAPTFLPLPTDRPRPAVQTFAGAYIEFELSMELTQKLTKLSQSQGVTLFMTLLAAFNILLYRYTGQTDILVGSPIANRERSEIEGLIGFFVNTLVLRTDVSGDPSFNELLPRLRSMALDAYAHQDLPFEMLVEALQPERDLSHTPLFQVMFALQNTPISEVELSGLKIDHLPIKTATAKFDLTLAMENTHTGLLGGWEYNSDLFDRSTIERMTGHFVTLLSAIVANPTERISQLPLLTPSEQQQLLVEWNQTKAEYPCDLCIHELFEEQVKCNPNAVAVVFENQQLTYQQLNSRANQLAHYLQSLGVGADVLVGICVERSLEMVVGLLGILKAGGAYVPLDPEYPTERLNFMLLDAQVKVLLTQKHLVNKLLEHQEKLVCLDDVWKEILQNKQDNPTQVVTAFNLANVIYTSGTTGKPKGVMVEHRGLYNLAQAQIQTFDLRCDSRILQFASLSFDASIWEVLMAFGSGATLYLGTKDSLMPGTPLIERLSNDGITHVTLPPSALAVLPVEELPALQTIVVAGEACAVELMLKWSALKNFFNAYGPTEASVCATVAKCTHNDQKVSIGRPISNAQVYILDQNLQPVPIGVPGELHIGGAGLARGYLNQPELTQEKFIVNPFDNFKVTNQKSKLYKTGDLARYLPDGNIEYLGRIDNQVKVRGFRIELREIEAVLSQHSDVQTSCVIIREDTPSDRRLVAYVVPQPQVTPTVGELRSFLKEKLPDYMVPKTIVILESLPLTPNGKIDRRALPIPESRTGIENEIVLPRTPIEEKLAQIWAQVLRVEVVGIHDNFFELGGDSILSIQIITRAKLAGIELTVKQLFAHQTIAELAAVAFTTKALEIEQVLVSGALPLTPIQQWFFEQEFPQKYHFNQSVLLTVPSNINLEILEQVWQKLLLHHDALRLRFTLEEGTWQQIHANPTDSIAISRFDLSTVPQSELSTTIETTANELQASLNLSENLVAVGFFWFGNDLPARLLIVIHHLVVDGVSWRILLEDLLTGYQQLETGQAIQLPAKTTSFKDWANRLVEYAQTEELKSELAYWLSASESEVAPLPVDIAQGANTVASASTVSVSLTSQETHSLLVDVPKAYKTQINDVLLTALVLVLSQWTHSKSVLFNLEGHGREDIVEGVDLSRTVGWFTTLFPVILKLEGIDRENIGQALKSVKEQLRAIPNKGIGYGLLRYLNVEPQISAQLQTIPTAEISFNYLGQFTQVANTSSVMQLATESSGQSLSLLNSRPSLVEINAIITNEQLQINWTYSNNIHLTSTIEKIALEFVATLRSLIAHCLVPENAGYTPTDFPLIKLNQQQLDGVLAGIAFKPELQSNWQKIEDIYPLSSMQEGMLFETLLAPTSGVYFQQIICTLTGSVDVKTFEQAWQQVVARHSIFRTAFVWESLSQPLQVVYQQVDVTLLTYDWRSLSPVEQQQQLETFLNSERQQGFQLSQVPLMRLHLLQMDDNTYQFVWCHHHILLDGWSLPLVFKDLLECYQAISQEESLPQLGINNYRNYIAWLQQQNKSLAAQFWRQKLTGFSAPTPLTVEKPLSMRSPHSSYSEQHFQFTVSQTDAVVSFARQHQLTISNLVQATWGLLLSRYSQQTDVVFGVTVSGRPPSLADVESIIGVFINTLPVRMQIDQKTELLSLLKDLQAQQLESEQFSHSSLVEIQGLSDVPKGTSLFESIVIFENYPVDDAVLEDRRSFSISNVWGIEQTNYPLTVLAASGEQLSLKVIYDTSRFEDSTISRMLGHFVTMLQAIVTNPQQPISSLPLLTELELQQLLVEWNNTSKNYPSDKCISDLFEEQVARTPNAVAVVFEDQQLTYQQLNCRANQLAHHLRSMGVSSDVLVGICVERSIEMVVGLLGILKAGGAYVPLDPEYPTERLRFILEDARVSVLLTQQHLVELLPTSAPQFVCLDTQWQQISQWSQENPSTTRDSADLAYVIYTSGSTGQPKGVQISHRSVGNFLYAMKQQPGITQQDTLLGVTTIAFDIAALEIFLPLIVGAKLALARRDQAQDGRQLVDLLSKSQATMVQATPATWRLLLEAQYQFSHLKILCGGEALPKDLAEQLRGVSAGVWNLYGPTETTIWSSVYQLESEQSVISIGRAIANTQFYILDSHLQPVPIGVPGELHIGGAGLARGYFNRPELTQEKFIPNPFSKSRGAEEQGSRGGERLYKTGDLARYLPDGNIEYLGRIDNQVKIRGFRIELGEVEAVLSQHEDVQVCCAIVREDNPGDRRLVAYIVPPPEQTPKISQIREFLSAKLPEYMVPSAIVILESLPLTPNGKVNRRALPAPDISSEFSDRYVAPRTPVEEILSLIWTQVLKVERVGIHDRFFELGGHSLLAMQLISRIRTSLKVELPLRSLFATPTIAALSQNIQQLQQQGSASAPPILPRQTDAELPLSYAQQRLWFLDQLEPQGASYNIPFALRLEGTLQVAALQQSFIEIIHRHEALRTNFVTVDGQASQVIHTATNWTVSVVELQHLSTSEKERQSQLLTQQQALQPFNLATEPLIRATLVVLSETEHLLLGCMHHIVSDGWSLGVLVEELTALYNAYSQGQPSPLVPLPIQYADFALWQRQWLLGEVLQSQLSYWREQLASAPTFLPLPTDRPRPAVQTFAGAYVEFELSMELTQKLTQLGQSQGVTLFMTLLAAFKVLLYRYTGQTDILVGSPIANRERSEIEGLIGFFVNTLVLRTDVSGDPSFDELLPQIREMALDAYAHQDLPFEMLVEALQPERDLSHTPLFQVMFVLQNAPMSDFELSGLTIGHLPIESATAKFDLTLVMENTRTGLVGGWEYNSDLFERSTIERMTGHFVTLLSAIVANPTERISQLPLLTPSEQQQLLVEWNRTEVDYPQDLCIHQLFEEQVKRNPDAVAVVFENQQLTYQQLNNRANQLAHYLQSLGVSGEVLVGIYMERSIEMVVGLLGILKAGGAYLPLAPEYPIERLNFMLVDARVEMLVTQQRLADRLAEHLPEHPARVVCLDTDWQFISHLPQANPLTSRQATDLAYVIYTSGSTGTPKGVPIAYRGLLNLVKWHQRAFNVTNNDKATQMAGTAFDAAIWELWPYLSAGACIYLVKSDLLTSPVNLREWLIENQITIAFVPTPVAQELLSLEWTTQSLALRCILTGGDKLHHYRSDAILFEVVNNYGPTENSVVTTSGLVMHNQKQNSPTIGRPIDNTKVYILDSHLQPVPIGVPGELHIAGVGLTVGYLNRPELTQEKFISNPFSTDPGSRLYKTGDLTRYLPNGDIEYLRRIDNQVKIRGFRIELGEIEACLSQHSQVQICVVIAREDNPQDKRLVAYIVPQPEQTLTVSQVREFLKEKLPDYMVPKAIVILESLPLTPNGKIDRRALPVPESRTGIENEIVLPRTPIEEKLAQIWAQVLRVPVVGIHDNFFELGGDSILSIQIITRAKQAGIELTVKQLFAHQTIAELATVTFTTKALSIEQGLVSGISPLTPIQNWFFEQEFPQKHHFNQSVLLTVPPNFKLEILEQVWQKLLLHHDALRLRFTLEEGTWQQTHAEPTEQVAISRFDLSTVSQSELSTTIETIANQLQASLNLSKNLVAVGFFWLGNDSPARLLIVIHHLVVDGVSWRILLEDLLTGYQQLETGQAIQLPAKTTSFKDWANRLVEYAQTEVLKSELAYWLSASESEVAPLPVDIAQGANTVASAHTVTVSLDEAQTLSLLQDVPKAYKTQINDVLLTALVLVLSRWTNSQSVLFNLEGHGREDIVESVDLSRTVGWFTTLFPVVLKLEGIDLDNIGQVLKSVKEQLRAIPNKGIGYGLLRYLNVEAQISAQLQTVPTAEISFNYLGQFTQVVNTSSVMQLATESSGLSQSLQGLRPNLLDINAIITNERLQIDWTYSSNIHQHKTIEKIALEFVETFRSLITHCLAPENAGYTPTDFPLIKLNQQQLDGVLAGIAFKPQLQSNWQNIEDIYPLSSMQEGMLFESLLAPNSGVYVEQIICTLTGSVDVKTFEQAWQQIVARHSIFRTAFAWESLSQPLQVVYQQVDVKLLTYDWRSLSPVEQQQQLETFLDSERQQGFQLSQAPLMRLHLLQMDENTYQFVWCHHHILLDGWSLPLVFKDLLECYQAISQGESLPQLGTTNYRNYIAWLQQQNKSLAAQFWQQKLTGFTSPTPLTVEKPLSMREDNSSYKEQQIQLTVSQTDAVVSFARQHQLTISNLVQATWGLLLSRYSSQTDVVFGVTVSGRPPSLVGVESIVGVFINTLPVRIQIAQKTELLSLLKDLQAQQLESEQFSYSSLVEIQGLSDVPKGTSLFESIVVFENYPVDNAVLKDNRSFSISNFEAIEQTNYPLTVVAASGEQLLLRVIYDTSRFEDSTISRMLGHFVTMLQAIVTNPQQQISSLPLLTESELQQLLVEWNRTEVDYPQNKFIADLFEEQVARTPHAVAVVFEDKQLTYQQLNCRANQLAHYLQSMGVGADVLVGIYMERSFEMLVGLLGILKAGGAYVPLDPEYPTERLRFMLENARARVLLTQQHLVEKLPSHQAQLVFLDRDWQEISQWSQENLISGVQGHNLVYVMYTSGSTGQPKGVAMNQFALCNLIWWQMQNTTISHGVRTLQFAPISFDFSFQEMLPTWCSGGTLILIKEELRREPLALLGVLQEQAVERVLLPVVGLQQLAEAAVGSESVTSHLREIIVGGEQLQITPAISNWFSQLSDCTLQNHYGPSECHVVTSFTLRDSVDTWPLLPPIGSPIANTQIYILDRYLQPVPVGVPGELYISGAGLARGYLNRPELTVEKFIPNPFFRNRRAGETALREGFPPQATANPKGEQESRGGERLYKTGDLARYLPDGNIEYLGRIDNQVKIRGFRIELSEIEAVLSQHEDVQVSCVIAREDTPGDKRLVAYIVPQPEQTPTASELLRFLKEKLPQYMVPSAIVLLESLPLTPTGKVNRRALPIPFNPNGSDTFVSPRNTIELQLVQIWSKILKVDLVGVKDNFFDLGGHSLLAPYLIAQIKQQFGKDIPLAILFQNPTIEELAEVLQKDANALSSSPLVAIQPTGSNPSFFCIPGAGRYPFYFYNLARCLGSEQPFYSFQALGGDGESETIKQVEDIAAQYLKAIQAVQPKGPYFLGGHSFGGKISFEIAQQLLSQGEEVALVAIFDTLPPIALAKPEEMNDTNLLISMVKILQMLFVKDLEMETEPLLSLTPDAQVNYVLDYLKILDILPPDACTTTYLKRLMQTFRADNQAFYEYVPQQVKPIPITLFRASEYYQQEPPEIKNAGLSQDLAWGWNAFSSKPVDVQFIPGNHTTMMTQPHVQVLAERLKACIEQAQANI
ncbi:amino acid adenylation domain-containing protein [Scytonema sp. UIC 10036]|uniref:non-ribosomal peptide synthetase n=1 Tax=Scytonema sp. UIC 10036 TaxID=2304196 RepID=UPI0012DAF077|nr:non-ribosomal peptide synthetase [Scytonema sp. UIC 10036]MUG94289.1 amino acid adenylation domain-containing protein [Scytonema sp. UIC 10036]